MPLFVSKAEMDELRRDAVDGRDKRKLEKAYRKQIQSMRDEHAEKIEDIVDEKDREINILQRKVDKADQVRENDIEDLNDVHVSRMNNLERDFQRVIDDREDTIAQLDGKVKVLQGRVATSADLTKRELAITDKEREVESAATLTSEREKALEKRVKEFEYRVADAKDGEYKRGYTDGVSDTLREGDERSKEANGRVYSLAEKALGKETTVITTTAPQVQKQGK